MELHLIEGAAGGGDLLRYLPLRRLQIAQRLLQGGVTFAHHPLRGLLRQLLVVDHLLVIGMEVVLAEYHPLDDHAFLTEHLAHLVARCLGLLEALVRDVELLAGHGVEHVAHDAAAGRAHKVFLHLAGRSAHVLENVGGLGGVDAPGHRHVHGDVVAVVGLELDVVALGAVPLGLRLHHAEVLQRDVEDVPVGDEGREGVRRAGRIRLLLHARLAEEPDFPCQHADLGRIGRVERARSR